MHLDLFSPKAPLHRVLLRHPQQLRYLLFRISTQVNTLGSLINFEGRHILESR